MRIPLFGLGSYSRKINNKEGSSTILMAIIMVGFVTCIVASISICRALVVKSEAEVFSHFWAKAILSEYDKHLLDDYKIMAYFGNEKEVNAKVDYYASYSCEGKLDAAIGKTSSSLGAYRLSDPSNFYKSIKNSIAEGVADAAIKSDRIKRKGESEAQEDTDKRLVNRLVVHTLPSSGVKSNISIKDFAKKLSEGGNIESITSASKSFAVEMTYMRLHFANNLYAPNDKSSFFKNEWEYVIEGKESDKANVSGCRKKIFVIRNVLNLASLVKDSEKMSLILEISELITPGPAAVITQGVIAEAWAAAEAESDVNILYDYGRVPLIKKPEEWKIGLGAVVDSKEVGESLDEEGKRLLSENEEEIHSKTESIDSIKAEITEGQNYEDYLMLLMASMNDNVRLLRMMDIIQINMKNRYYRDFNMSEYYVGTKIVVEANGKAYEAEEFYR